LKKEVSAIVQTWVESFVIKFNLCPFAKRELINNTIRFTVTEVESEELLIKNLQDELELLTKDKSIETTLLIHPRVLQDFYDYNQFLNIADNLLLEMNLVGIYQIASFC